MKNLFETIKRITGHDCIQNEMHEIIDCVKNIEITEIKEEKTTDLKTEIKKNLDLYRNLWEQADYPNIDRFMRGWYQGQYHAYKRLMDKIKNGSLK